MITESQVYECLKKVMDPELHIDVVSLGLIYDVTIRPIQTDAGEREFIHILLTLTTPGCPLAGTFDAMIKDALSSIEGLDINKEVMVELTFDPPWIADMMTEEVRAELGFD